MARRAEVLQLYKCLHRTVQSVCQGDSRALQVAQVQIRTEFNKNRHVKKDNAISELITLGNQVDQIFKEQVIQLEQIQPDQFRANIRPTTKLFDNIPFRDNITDEEYRSSRRRGKSKCNEVVKEKKS